MSEALLYPPPPPLDAPRPASDRRYPAPAIFPSVFLYNNPRVGTGLHGVVSPEMDGTASGRTCAAQVLPSNLATRKWKFTLWYFAST